MKILVPEKSRLCRVRVIKIEKEETEEELERGWEFVDKHRIVLSFGTRQTVVVHLFIT